MAAALDNFFVVVMGTMWAVDSRQSRRYRKVCVCKQTSPFRRFSRCVDQRVDGAKEANERGGTSPSTLRLAGCSLAREIVRLLSIITTPKSRPNRAFKEPWEPGTPRPGRRGVPRVNGLQCQGHRPLGRLRPE